MLVNHASGTHGVVYMERDLAFCVSAVFSKGKNTVLHMVKGSLENICCLDAFINIESKNKGIAAAGDRF